MQITDHSCDILDQAVHRYFKVIFSPARGQVKRPHDDSLDQKLQQEDNFSGYLDQVSIELKQPCHRYPSYKADENCESITVGNGLNLTEITPHSRLPVTQPTVRLNLLMDVII